jgi:hypothetical protein
VVCQLLKALRRHALLIAVHNDANTSQKLSCGRTVIYEAVCASPHLIDCVEGTREHTLPIQTLKSADSVDVVTRTEILRLLEATKLESVRLDNASDVVGIGIDVRPTGDTRPEKIQPRRRLDTLLLKDEKLCLLLWSQTSVNERANRLVITVLRNHETMLTSDDCLLAVIAIRHCDRMEKLRTESVRNAPDPRLVKRTLILIRNEKIVHGNLPIRWHMY